MHYLFFLLLFGAPTDFLSNYDVPFKLIEEKFTALDKESMVECTLTITGFADHPILGRIPISLSATESTCEEAAAKLRPTIIELKIRIER